MNIPQTRLNYVHINSRHRLESGTEPSKADLKVHLSKPIKNVWRVYVKSFTLANHAFNIIDGQNVLHWVEFYRPPTATTSFQFKEFSITIPQDFYTGAELASQINTQIEGMANHKVDVNDANETELGIFMSQNSSKYTMTIQLDNDYGLKLFAPVGKEKDIWRYLGFTHGQMVLKLTGKKDISVEYQAIADALQAGYDTNYVYYNALFTAGTPSLPFTYRSQLPATIESPPGIFITSKNLSGGGTYQSRVNPDHHFLEAAPRDIIEWIRYDVSRYSYVNYSPAVPTFHYLNEAQIHDVDLQIRSEHGTILDHDQLGDYHIILAFECVVEPEFSPEFLQEYYAEAYKKQHTPDVFRLK